MENVLMEIALDNDDLYHMFRGDFFTTIKNVLIFTAPIVKVTNHFQNTNNGILHAKMILNKFDKSMKIFKDT